MRTTRHSSPDGLGSVSATTRPTVASITRDGDCPGRSSTLRTGETSREGKPGRYSHVRGSSVGVRSKFSGTTTREPIADGSDDAQRHNAVGLTIWGRTTVLRSPGLLATTQTQTITPAARR